MTFGTNLQIFNTIIQSSFFSTPFKINFAITSRCNSRCKTCNIWKIKKDISKELTFSEIDIFFKKLPKTVSWLSLTGGEPLLRKDIGEIISFSKKLGIKTTLVSNGSLVKDKIQELKDLDLLIISLEGPKEMHDAIRGKGTFDKTIEAITIAKEHNLNVWVEIVLTQKSDKKLKFILKKSKELGFSVLFQPIFNYKLSASKENIEKLSPKIEEYKNLVKKIIELKKQYNIVGSYSYFKYILNTWPRGIYPNCKAGKLFVSISPSGNIAPCHFLINAREWPNGIKLGFKRAFENIKDNSCDGCFCNSYIETNLLFSKNIESKINFLKNFRKVL